jgi:hypothetical protein
MIDVLTVLRDVYGLTSDDVRRNNNEALYVAAIESHQKTLDALRDTYKLTGRDAHEAVNHWGPLDPVPGRVVGILRVYFDLPDPQ